jgi:hypothetical protein
LKKGDYLYHKNEQTTKTNVFLSLPIEYVKLYQCVTARSPVVAVSTEIIPFLVLLLHLAKCYFGGLGFIKA